MNLDGEGVAARGLRRYVGLVAEAIGVGSEASILQFDDPVSVYLALDRCVAAHPDRDVALLWDELHGWALAVELDGADVRVLGYLDGELLPEPRAVARFVERACRDEGIGVPEPPSHRAEPDLAGRLADYAERIHVALPGSFAVPAARVTADATPS